MTQMSNKPYQVDLVYHYFAHYREPIIRNLVNLDEINLHLISGLQANTPIKLIDFHQSSFSWSPVKNYWLPGGWLWQSGLLKRICHTEASHLIFLGQFNFLSSCLAVPFARFRGKNTLFWTHGVYGNEHFLKRLLRLYFYKLADRILLYGNHSREILIKAGFDPERLYVVYNSLDYESQLLFRPTEDHTPADELEARRALFPASPHDPVIIFLGRLTASKNISLLIDLIDALKNQQHSVNLLIVGDGPEASSLRARAHSSPDAARIQFTGPCYDESQIAQYFRLADICISPGNVGLLAMHAMTYGVPVITHDDPVHQGPEFEAVISGRTGYLYRHNSFPSLVDTTRQFLALDLETRAIMRKNCMTIIDRYFNPTKQVEVILSALRGIPASSIDFSYQL